MKIKTILCSISLTLGLGMFTSCTFAGGLSLLGIGTRANTLQAFTGVADDPSAIYYNPAGITQVSGTAVEGDLYYVNTPARYFSAIPNPMMFNVGTSSNKKIVAPDFFVTHDAGQNVTVGIGVEAPFARGSRFTVNGASFFNPMNGYIVRVDTLPTIAVKLNDHVSVGGGLVLSHLISRLGLLGLAENGSGDGVSAQAGILIKPVDKVRIGFTFHGPEDNEVTGHSSLVLAALPMEIKGRFASDFHLPAVYSVGASMQITPSVLAAIGYDYELWQRFHTIRTEFNNPAFLSFSTIPLDPSNSSNYRVGVEYRPLDHHNNSFRLGYEYTTHAVPAVNFVPIINDYDGDVYDLGYSHYFSHSRVDIGFEHAFGYQRFSNSPIFPGKYQLSINTIVVGGVVYFS